MTQAIPMTLTCRRVGHWALNAYALISPGEDPVKSRSVLIDPGAEPDVLVKMLEGTSPVAILITHGHIDHIEALEEVRRRLGVPVMAHRKIIDGGQPIEPDRLLDDGDRIEVGSHMVSVVHTPGHTPEQVCYRIESDHRIIVGDTIFKGGPGRTWSAEDFQTTLETLRYVLRAWPDETHCYPGHGLSFNLGEQRQAIEDFLRRDHGAFFGNATWDMSDEQ